ncbi:3-hydroxyacyl-CoA dehydrogenase family protein [Glaciimonas sp. CA11.2]|uniref:3-hydroxyacyl-CoA dehydrogenase family protein n=1 Tax=unclassified Glaciimonas TaxID=2644401 RepID=UPI002AB5CAD9|nr:MULTISPECIES: 3-hydroxyacyl-CoA dehydrogenase family protein [unclassified Glaciimonas]MDY7548421.1 3-hydroxyacyl-CoA dehydrogenase family protein [Glaciimonas sp. CA11.2]MEB0010429.1 3-hydroxyacyl-CoA dehydrogenase family protein [Glaciimonas sp. Cout2]MEB0083974.1 3-hydroxyacyl-CoA dehydrogenase family protein [Glaciimonas sp. Gout2]MEB0164450.1 3-hydroxyacyl-CoA dehydrogenase family protein [Glaciimonas sp. CA11.2]
METPMQTPYCIISSGISRSFPVDHSFIAQADSDAIATVYLGAQAGAAYRSSPTVTDAVFIAIELDIECLGVHVDTNAPAVRTNVVGIARFRLGDAEPSNLIELVRLPQTSPVALAAAKGALEAAGLVVAVCGDFPGRIVNRLVRPYYNAALRRLDEQLASAEDMDMTLRLGLGYPEGPIALLKRTGLADHCRVSEQLYQALRQEPYAPARAAQMAMAHSQGD